MSESGMPALTRIFERLASCDLQREAADVYASALSTHGLRMEDYSRINAAIAKRWGIDGLGRIKRKAWKIAQAVEP